MIEMLSADFELELLYDKEPIAVLGAVKGSFVHLLVYCDNQTRQFYIHRHEWADFLLSEHKNNNLLTYCGVLLFRNLKTKKTGIYFREEERLFSTEKTTLGKQLIEDTQTLLKIRKQSGSEAFRKRIIKKIDGFCDETNIETFTDWELEISAFENAILTASQKRKNTAAVYKLLNYRKSDRIPVMLFLEATESIIEKTSCDCGNEACFFDLLNHTFLTHFKDKKRFFTKGKFDPEKGEAIFMEYWEKLPDNKKMILQYLDYTFGNTALLNMAFFNPDFDILNYQRIMTFPYQPDDPDEAWVRQHSSLCAHYLFRI